MVLRLAPFSSHVSIMSRISLGQFSLFLVSKVKVYLSYYITGPGSVVQGLVPCSRTPLSRLRLIIYCPRITPSLELYLVYLL